MGYYIALGFTLRIHNYFTFAACASQPKLKGFRGDRVAQEIGCDEAQNHTYTEYGTTIEPELGFR